MWLCYGYTRSTPHRFDFDMGKKTSSLGHYKGILCLESAAIPTAKTAMRRHMRAWGIRWIDLGCFMFVASGRVRVYGATNNAIRAALPTPAVLAPAASFSEERI